MTFLKSNSTSKFLPSVPNSFSLNKVPYMGTPFSTLIQPWNFLLSSKESNFNIPGRILLFL